MSKWNWLKDNIIEAEIVQIFPTCDLQAINGWCDNAIYYDLISDNYSHILNYSFLVKPLAKGETNYLLSVTDYLEGVLASNYTFLRSLDEQKVYIKTDGFLISEITRS